MSVATTSTAVRGFRAYPTRRHDGDSFWVMYDGGCDARVEPELRLIDVHAPELRALPLPRLAEPGAMEATEFVNGWLASQVGGARRWCLWVEIVLTKTFEPEMRTTFRRFLATVYPYDRRGPEDSLNHAVTTFLSGHPEWPSGQ